MWVFAVLIVLAMGGVALLAAGRGAPMAPAYDDRPDALVPAGRPLRPDDLRRVRFSLAVRGYRMAEVDELLSRLARELEDDRPRGVPETSGVGPAPAGLVRMMAEKWAADHPAGTDILDFSTESVDQVESSLDQWSRQRERGLAADEPDVWAAGAYLGEVIVRAVPGARWCQHAAFGELPVVAMPSGRFENPVGKAMERYDGDESDSVAFFLDAALAAESRAG
ncbi:DivIVA domain-containing protein [Nocardioides albidus]|uniref:DivIVA domain-containing protein n=2 Tax=Nocardioides albidus TaxID=1517589 RepID=A0A5C4VRF5_9ACTN|nr:DivIVA domain-containing protein [Nocardioides albidus]